MHTPTPEEILAKLRPAIEAENKANAEYYEQEPLPLGNTNVTILEDEPKLWNTQSHDYEISALSKKTGRPADGVEVLNSNESLKEKLQSVLKLSKANRDGLFSRLIAGEQVDQTQFEPVEGHIFGHHYTCDSCSGRGQSNCDRCKGNGNLQCWRCKGRRTLTCSSCAGHGSHMCTLCLGQGGGPHPQTGMWINCLGWQCAGGYYPCGCDNGDVTCSQCSGKGLCKCSACNKGKQGCEDCHGTGSLHTSAQVTLKSKNRWVFADQYSPLAGHKQSIESLAEQKRPPEGFALSNITATGPDIVFEYGHPKVTVIRAETLQGENTTLKWEQVLSPVPSCLASVTEADTGTVYRARFKQKVLKTHDWRTMSLAQIREFIGGRGYSSLDYLDRRKFSDQESFLALKERINEKLRIPGSKKEAEQLMESPIYREALDAARYNRQHRQEFEQLVKPCVLAVDKHLLHTPFAKRRLKTLMIWTGISALSTSALPVLAGLLGGLLSSYWAEKKVSREWQEALKAHESLVGKKKVWPSMTEDERGVSSKEAKTGPMEIAPAALSLLFVVSTLWATGPGSLSNPPPAPVSWVHHYASGPMRDFFHNRFVEATFWLRFNTANHHAWAVRIERLADVEYNGSNDYVGERMDAIKALLTVKKYQIFSFRKGAEWPQKAQDEERQLLALKAKWEGRAQLPVIWDMAQCHYDTTKKVRSPACMNLAKAVYDLPAQERSWAFATLERAPYAKLPQDKLPRAAKPIEQ